MSSEIDRAAVIKWLSQMEEKQFAEFFYSAVKDRSTADFEDEIGHFVLADAHNYGDGRGWFTDFIAPAQNDNWIDDAPICQSGICRNCQNSLRSWDKQLICPICGIKEGGT